MSAGVHDGATARVPGGPDVARVPGRPDVASALAPALLLAFALGTSTGCAAAPATTPDLAIRLPAPDVVVDYQLGGAYPPPAGVGGVARDSTELPEPGLYSLCYVNGFQTQPGETARWLAEHPDLVLRDDDGAPVADPGWPDEVLLDTSTAARREAIAAVVGEAIERCAASGFDAVEVDNLDSATRSGGRLTADDALALATLYGAHAHRLGLAIAQKNAAYLAARGRDEVGFDLAVAEECHRWDECQLYTDVYDVVLDIEYDDDLRGTFADVCADPATPTSTVLRDRALSTPQDDGYVFARC